MATVPTDENSSSQGMFSAQPEQNESGIPLDYTKRQAPVDTRSPAEDAVALPSKGMFDDEQEAKPIGGGLFDPTEQLKAAVHYGAQTSSDEAARILRLKEATALPEDLVGRNTDELERETRVKAFDVPDFVKRSPITAEWLSQSPNHTAATWNILPKLGKMEDFFTRPAHLDPLPDEDLQKIARARAEKRTQEGYDNPHRKMMPSSAVGSMQFTEMNYQEELAKLRREEEFISGNEPVGIIENTYRAFDENKAAALPHFGSLATLDNKMALYQAAKAAIAKEATPEQMELLIRNARLEEAASRRGLTTPAQIAASVAKSAVFAAEFMTTPGYNLVKGFFAKAAPEVAATTLIQKGMKLALQGTGWALGSEAQSLANPTRIASGTVARITPQTGIGEDGKLQVDESKAEPFLSALKNAMVTDFAQVASERTGETIGKVAGAAGAKVLGWLSLPAQKAVRAAIAAIPESELGAKVGAVLKAGGYNGVIPEMIEERVGEGIEAAGGAAEWKLPTAHDLMVEGIAFSIPGTVRAAANRVGQARARTKGFTDYGNDVKEVLERPEFKDPEGNGVKIVEKIIEFQSEKAGRPSVLIPVEAWNKYWVDKEQDPAVAWEQIVGPRESYDEANEQGTDLIIPTARYAIGIAATEHNKPLAKHLRWKENDGDKLSESEAEAEERAAEIEKTEAEATKLELGTEGAKLRDELQAAGQAPEFAEKNALLIQEFAARQDIPLELARTILPLAIQQGTPTKKDGGLEQAGIPQTEFSKPESIRQVVADPADSTLSASEAKKLSPRGNYLNGHTQWQIGVSKKGLSKSEGGAKSPAGAVSLKYIGQLLEAAIYDRVEQPLNTDTNIKAFHIFYAPFQMDGKMYAVRIKVRETNEGEKFYHSMTSEEARPAANLGGNAEANQRQAVDGPRSVSLADFENLINAERKNFPLFQSALPVPAGQTLPAKSDLSPLGFYSQVSREVEKMDFKEMPAKDLWNRIKNIQGIKAEELETLGLEEFFKLRQSAANEARDEKARGDRSVFDAAAITEAVEAPDAPVKVTKAEVLDFIRSNGVQVEQVVLARDFKGSTSERHEAAEAVEAADLSWDEEGEQLSLDETDPEGYEVDEESKYFLREAPEDYFPKEWKNFIRRKENKPLWAKTKKKGADWQLKYALYSKFEKEATDEMRDKAVEMAQESLSSPDSYHAQFRYMEEQTGWTLVGNDERGWYSPEADAFFEGELAEAKVQIIEKMIAKGAVRKSELAKLEELAGTDPTTLANTPRGRSKFDSYKVDGGTNYREVLLTLPNMSPAFTEGHWSQKNVLAHVRLTDRTDAEGRKVLFVEELQSDWHQKGRERGYKSDAPEQSNFSEWIKKRRPDISAEEIKNLFEAREDGGPEYIQWRDEQNEAFKNETERVADAPFKNTDAWAALAMKRILRLAVEQGYDSVAWAPAEVHTDRWGTDSVSWVKKSGPRFEVRNSKVANALEKTFSTETAANDYIRHETHNQEWFTVVKVDTPYWMVGSVEQVGGNADGVDIEAQARERGKLLERKGTGVTTKEELRKVIADTLNRERNERSLEALTESVWKQMQEKDSGVKAPRKEGFEFFYNNLLPKKVVPAILKKLDKNAKVEVGDIGGFVGKRYVVNSDEEAVFEVLDRKTDRIYSNDYNTREEAENAANELNAATKGDGEGFKSWQVILTDEMKAKAKNEGFSLFQPANNDSDARGQIKLYNDRAQMTLSKMSDASTVPHEFAHYFLQIMGILSEMPDASQKVKDRYAAALKFLGVESKDQLLEEHHEKFARSFEAYLLNGEAPTAQLKALFQQFKEWLKAVYKAAPPEVLTPEAKEFFDSIFAAEAEVEQARAQQMMTPLFKDMKAAGFSDEQALSMQSAIQEAQEASQSELTAKTFQEADKKRGKEYEENRELVRSQIEEEVSHQPVYIALSVLQKGVFPDGSEIPDGPLKGLKLDRDSLKKEWPGQMKSLPKPYVYAKEGGLHPDMAAELLGFSSGSELITALVEAEPMDQLVDRLTDEQMKAQYPTLLETGALSVEAMKAVHNDKQDELYRKELEYMLSEHFAKFKQMTRRIAGRPPAPTASIKEQAAAAIAKKQVRETNPLLYQRAEAKAGKEAADLLLKGDFAGAVEAKTRQRYNHALYRAAVEAKENAEKAAEYMRKFDKPSVRQRMGKAGGSYLEQIEAIQERFSFKTISGKAIDRKNDLRAWVEEQREEGYDVELPEKLLNESNRKNYKELTNAELAEVRETVENIEHLAGLKNKLLANEKVREIEEAETMIVSSIGAHHEIKGEVLPLAPGLKDKILQKKSKYFAAHTRMEFLFEFLDGVKAHGAAWNLLFKPFVDAELSEMEMAKKDAEALGKIFGVYSQKERAGWFGAKTYFFPEAKTDKFDGNLNKANILAIALNWGNEYNREALMEGYGWNEAQVLKILEVLDEKDVATVNALWAHIDTYWESARDLQKELSGVAPAKVQGSPAVIRAGKLNGGYYPIKFDNDRSYRQLQLDEKAALGEQFGHATRGMTRHGHLKERTNTGGKPLLLNLAVISGHLSQVRHDISHRRAVIDVGRLINRPKIREAIIGAAGSEMYRQLNPWIKGIAGDTQPDLIDGWESFLGLMRTNMTKVNLGLKVTSGLVQTLGFLNTIHVIGPTYAAKGLKALNPAKLKETWAFITERSAMMQNRLDNYDRDVRDLMMKQNVAKGADTAWFYHIGFMDLSLSVPTWLGAYQQAMDGEVENIDKGDEKSAVEYADSTVRKTMAAGAAKDLAQVQRGNELKRLFTAFYSQLSIQFNLMQQAGQHFGLTKDYAKLTSAFIFLWILPAILDDVIKGRGPDDEEEWLPWMAKKAGAYPFQTMVLTRDIVNMMERKFETGRRADYTMSPVVQGVESLANATYAGFKPFMQDEEFTRADAKDVVMATGYMVGLPSRQVWMTSEYLYDYMTGEVQPSNPAEAAWRALVTGKPKEK